MDYIEITFQNSSAQGELIIALLSEEYESFEETDAGVKAYIPAEKYSEERLKELLGVLFAEGNISFSKALIQDRNWNALWESNFEPVIISDQVLVRAPFHPSIPGVQFEIVIEPKMSFGTGHHATTSLMMEEMLKMNLEKETVLDMGCGSGILAILAAKMKAKNILAIDTDEWAFQNAFENCRLNESQHIIVQKGDINMVRGKAFDVILANINRNVLMADMNDYVASMKVESHLLMSGFIIDDVNLIIDVGKKNHLRLLHQSVKNRWALVHFQKVT